MQPAEIQYVDDHHIACDGGGGALGHPKIYLHIKDDTGKIDCPYCGRNFVYRAAYGKKSAH
jgi:uncharacterized Zn-finger protein